MGSGEEGEVGWRILLGDFSVAICAGKKLASAGSSDCLSHCLADWKSTVFLWSWMGGGRGAVNGG